MQTTLRHLSCGRGKPLGVRIFPRRFKGFMECHCIYVESPSHRILVDSGLSRAELEDPRRLGPFARGLGLQADTTLAAVSQLAALGRAPSDVTDIVLTHMDLDHAGGVQDFPQATVHAHGREVAAATTPRTMGERLRYRPDQWRNARLVRHDTGAATNLRGAEAAAPILQDDGLTVSLVPLFGHTRGHCGVLIETPDAQVLHSGDVYYDASELDTEASLLFACFLRSIHVKPKEARASLMKLRQWRQQHPEVRFVSSHDPREFADAAAGK